MARTKKADRLAKEKKDADKKAANTLDPWERQPTDTDAAWQAFVVYRDLGAQRSIRMTCSELGKSLTLVGGWSTKHDWVKRAAAWDNHVDSVKRESRLEVAVEIARRHADEARDLQSALLEPVKAYLKKLAGLREKGKDPFEGYTLKELQRAAETAARLWVTVATFERLSRGLSTSNVGGHDGGPLVDWAEKPKDECEAFLLGFEDGARSALDAAEEQLNASE